MKNIYLIGILCLTLFSCSSDSETPNDVQIRISNVSEFNFENISVSSGGDLVNFGNLNSNSKSEYRAFGIAYRYGFVEFQIAGETYTLQPIDYVGETPLANGKYSYEINVDPNSEFQKVILELKNE